MTAADRVPLNRLSAAVQEPVTVSEPVEVILTLSWPGGRTRAVSGLASAWAGEAVFVSYEGGYLGWFPAEAVKRSG